MALAGGKSHIAEDGFKVGGGTGVSCDLCGLGAGDGREIPFLTVLAPEVGLLKAHLFAM